MVSDVLVLSMLSIAALISTLVFMAGFLAHSENLKRLQKDGKLETKKGTYTFTPKEKTTNE